MRNTHGIRFFLRFVAGCVIIYSLFTVTLSQVALGAAPDEVCADMVHPQNVLDLAEGRGLVDAERSYFPAELSCTWKMEDGTTKTFITTDDEKTKSIVIDLVIGAIGLAIAVFTAVLSVLAHRRRR